MMRIAKVCGITTNDDARMALAFGADLVGFVRHPSSPRHCHDLAGATEAVGERGVLVSVGDSLAAMIEEAVQHRLGWIQPYVPTEQHADAARLAHAAGLKLLMPWPDTPDQRPTAADLYVWETSHAQTGVHGGSGQAHAASHPPPGPFLLAGGLDGASVAARIAALAPGVRALCRGADAASRLEQSPGRKSTSKVEHFVSTVHACAL